MGHSKTRTNLAHKLKSKRSARIGVLILIGGMLALITEAQFEPRTVKVARVIDGDTIQVLSDGRQYTVRLIGADTPETKHPTEAVQRFGQEASAFTTRRFQARRPHSAARDGPHRRHRGPHLWALASLRLPGRPELQRPAHQ